MNTYLNSTSSTASELSFSVQVMKYQQTLSLLLRVFLVALVRWMQSWIPLLVLFHISTEGNEERIMVPMQSTQDELSFSMPFIEDGKQYRMYGMNDVSETISVSVSWVCDQFDAFSLHTLVDIAPLFLQIILPLILHPRMERGHTQYPLHNRRCRKDSDLKCLIHAVMHEQTMFSQHSHVFFLLFKLSLLFKISFSNCLFVCFQENKSPLLCFGGLMRDILLIATFQQAEVYIEGGISAIVMFGGVFIINKSLQFLYHTVKDGYGRFGPIDEWAHMPLKRLTAVVNQKSIFTSDLNSDKINMARVFQVS